MSEDNDAAKRQQSLADLEELYVWLQQFEDHTIPPRRTDHQQQRLTHPQKQTSARLLCSSRVPRQNSAPSNHVQNLPQSQKYNDIGIQRQQSGSSSSSTYLHRDGSSSGEHRRSSSGQHSSPSPQQNKNTYEDFERRNNRNSVDQDENFSRNRAQQRYHQRHDRYRYDGHRLQASDIRNDRFRPPGHIRHSRSPDGYSGNK